VQERDGTRKRRFVHIACMLESGERLIKSRKADDVRAVIVWPDRPPEITSSRIERRNPATALEA
jgi:hypothetical protein